jgi:hypothetical protein
MTCRNRVEQVNRGTVQHNRYYVVLIWQWIRSNDGIYCKKILTNTKDYASEI